MTGRMMDPADLVGLHEAAAILSLTDGTVAGLLARDPSFPRPVQTLRATKVWLASDLRQWQAARVKSRAGRPTNAQRLAAQHKEETTP